MMGKTFLALAFYAAVSLPALAAGTPEVRPLTFGIFPRWNAQITVRNFAPLGQILSRELGREVRIETEKDFETFMRRVYAREFDLVHLNQLQFIRAHQIAGYRAIAKMCENPSCTIKAVIVTRKDARLGRVGDLRGKTIAFGDPEAMVSYVLAKSLLLESALPSNHYRTIFTKNPPNALLAVYNGDADAAGIGSSVLQRPEIRQRIDIGQLRIIAAGRAIPSLPIAVRSNLDPDLVRRLRRILTGLARQPGGSDVLVNIGIQRFEPAADAEYTRVRELVDETDATS